MILPDVNVLVYALRRDAEHHLLCKRWLINIVSSEAPFGISPLALAALVRVATGKKMAPSATTLNEAIHFADHLLGQPHCQIVEPGPRHWDIFKSLCIETYTTGPKTTDAWYAALAIEHNCEWITFDRDFARFPGLTFSEPVVS